MRIQIEAKTEKGALAIKNLYKNRSVLMMMQRARAEITNENPVTMEISQAMWSKMNAKEINNHKPSLAAVLAPMHIVMMEENVSEDDYVISCI